MGNSLDIDLIGKHVIIKGTKGVFLVTGGFGARAKTMGTGLFVTNLDTKKEYRYSGYDVERLATKEEIISEAI